MISKSSGSSRLVFPNEILSRLDEGGYCVFELQKTHDFSFEVESFPNKGGFIEGLDLQKRFFKNSGLDNFLTVYGDFFNYQTSDDIYFVTRIATSESNNMAYQSHLDSHRYTIVVPVEVPCKSLPSGSRGELYLVPQYRNEKNRGAVSDALQKLGAKRFSGLNGFKALRSQFQGQLKVLDLSPGSALLFRGDLTLHGNFPIGNGTFLEGRRVSLIFHWDDPVKYSLGSVMRMIRKIFNVR